MTEEQYEGLQILYYDYQSISAKYQTCKKMAELKDSIIGICMNDRDSLILLNENCIDDFNQIDIKLEAVKQDISSMEQSLKTWKIIGISASVGFTGLLTVMILR